MAQYSNLKAYIEEKIYENGTQAITGDILQDVLKVMTDDLGEFYQTGGVASPSTDPGTPDAKVIYIATEAGSYTNFGGIELAAGEVALLVFDTTWTKVELNVLSAANGGVKTANLADGAVTTAKIANGAVGEGKIADASVTSGKLGSGAVTTEKIADGAATTDKIADKAVATGKLGDKAVTSGKIADKAVGTGQVADEAITEGKIADAAVTSDKIAENAVTTAKIDNGAVIESKIQNDAVKTAKIGSKAVTTAKIADKAVTSGQLGDKAVTTDKIADGAVGSDQLAEGAFSAQNLADGSVTTNKLADDAVTAEKIADGAVTAGKFADGSVSAAKLASGAVITEKIGDGMVTRQKLADSSVGTSKIIDGAVTTAKVADANVTTAKIADANVTTGKLADGAVTTAKIADGDVTGAKLQEGVRPVINVNALNEQTTAYGSAALARAAVPSALRILGLHVIYLLAGGWFEDEFIGSDVSGWGTASNWRAVGPVSVSQNTSTGHTDISVGNVTISVASKDDVEKLFPVITGAFIWSNGYINFTTGNFVAQDNYRSTQKLSKDIREIITNIEHLGVDTSGIYRGSHLSFWNNGVYVGYMHQNVVKDPSGNILADIPTYDAFVINEFKTYDPDYANNIKMEIKYSNLVLSNEQNTKAVERHDSAIQEIALGFIWDNSYYDFASGTRIAQSAYRSTSKIPKDFKNLITNIEHLGVDTSGEFRGSYLSFWNNGVYVGYMEQGVIKDPTRTTLADLPEYDEFAISDYYNWDEDYDKNIVFKGLPFLLQDIDSLRFLIRKNTSSISLCVDGLLEWIAGAYYNPTNGSISTSVPQYSCSKIYPKEFYDINLGIIESLLSYSWTQYSYWKDGVYVGDRNISGYHLPDGTEVESIDFDEFAINLSNVQIPDYQTSVKFISLSDIGNGKNAFNRSFYALGDSTTYGAGSSQSPVKSWSDYLNEIALFNSYAKLAISGAFCVYHEGYGRLSAEIDNVPANTTGIVAIMIGTNDFYTDSPLGDAAAALAANYADLDDTTTFANAFRYCLEKLKRKAPNAVIVVMQPLPSFDAGNAHGHLDETNLFAQRDIQRTICNAMGIPIVESQNIFGLSRYTDNWNYFFNDFCHPNDTGYQRIAHCMLGKFIELAQ